MPRISPFLPLLLLAGCATNALRVQGATDFATASRATVAKTSTYLTDVSARQREAAVALVASDPTCFPGETVRIRYPNNGRQPLCMRRGERQDARNSFDFTLEPLGPKQIGARAQLIAAIADYAAALEKIVGADKPDVSAEITGFAEKLEDLRAIANFVAGSDIPSASAAIKTEQAKSLIGLLQFAEELRQEQLQVDAIRRLVASRGDVVDATLASLLRQIDALEEYDRDNAGIQLQTLVERYERESTRWDADRRAQGVRAIMAARSDKQARPIAAKAIKDAVVELEAAHRAMRDLLQPDPRLSDKQRKELRRIARLRLWRVLDLVASAATAFGGV